MLRALTTIKSNFKEKEFLEQKRTKAGTLFEKLLEGYICHRLRWEGDRGGDRLRAQLQTHFYLPANEWSYCVGH